MSFSDPKSIVNLNVGGVRFTTQLKTLTRFTDTVIGGMFSGRHALSKGEDGYFFIDRDGTHFRHILNFLRTPQGYKVEVVGADERELRRESEYYGIDDRMFNCTQMRLVCYNMQGDKSNVNVRLDEQGVITIRDTGGLHI
jgi:hypothetical protein